MAENHRKLWGGLAIPNNMGADQFAEKMWNVREISK
jgi:hypothetical protein